MARADKRGMSLRRKAILAGVALFFLVLLISSLFGRKGLLEIYRARKNYETLLRDIRRLEDQKTKLEREIQELQTDPRAVEREAREKLWLMKPEEKVIVKKKEEKR
ncbi:MAG: septum formation initiator family protein [Acidobacteriota bacterium]